MSTNYFKIKTGAKLSPLASSVSAKGDWGYNSSTDKFELYNGAVSALVSQSKAATLTNKTLAISSNTFTNFLNASIVSAAGIPYSKLALTASIVFGDIVSTSAATGSTLASRNASGNASFTTITGTLTGVASGNAIYTPSLYGLMVSSASSATLNAIDPAASLNKVLTSYGTANPIWKLPSQVNGFTNPSAVVDTSNWTVYADAAQNTPVDATGGSPSSTWTRTTSSPLRNSAAFLWTRSANNRQGEGVATTITLDPCDVSKVVSLTCDYKVVSGTFFAADGITPPLNDGTTSQNIGMSDLEFFVLDLTNSVWIPCSTQVLTSTSTTSAQFKCTFQSNPDSTSYRVAIHTARSTAVAFTMQFTNFMLGNQPITNHVTPSTEPMSYTPTYGAGWGTVTAGSIKSWRSGASLFGTGVFTIGTTNAGSASFTHGYDGVNNAVSSSITPVQNAIAGMVSGNGVLTTQFGDSRITTVFTQTGRTKAQFDRTSSTGNGFAAANASPFYISASTLSFLYSMPVDGWKGVVPGAGDIDDTIIFASANIITGNVSTTASTQINYTNILSDSHNCITTGVDAWQFKCKFPGVYICTLSAKNVSDTQNNVYVYKNGVLYAGLCNSDANVSSGAAPVPCIADDYLDFRMDSTATPELYGTAPAGASIVSILRYPQPMGIASVDSVNARLYASATTLTGSLATIVWTTTDYSSHGPSVIAAGVYTIVSPGKYRVNTFLNTAGTFVLNSAVNMQVQRNGTVVAEKTEYAAAVVTNLDISISDEINFLAGDLVQVQASSTATGPSIVSSNTQNYFSIAKVS